MYAESTGRTPAALVNYLAGICYPCTRVDLVEYAEDNLAPEPMLDILEEIPNKSYRNLRDVLGEVFNR